MSSGLVPSSRTARGAYLQQPMSRGPAWSLLLGYAARAAVVGPASGLLAMGLVPARTTPVVPVLAAREPGMSAQAVAASKGRRQR
jgi:hypothetical protein